jgi:hypothetical protein
MQICNEDRRRWLVVIGSKYPAMPPPGRIRRSVFTVSLIEEFIQPDCVVGVRQRALNEGACASRLLYHSLTSCAGVHDLSP